MIISPISPPLHLVLVEPQIPPNTGNVARLCAVTGCRLILVGPLGFSIDQKDLRRAGLDYWDKVFQCFYPTLDEYIEAHPYARRYLFSARVCRPFWEVQFQPGDHLVFGSETKGLPKHWIEENQKHTVTLPMLPDRRSLNLSTTVGIAAYEAIRQISYTPT